MIGDLGMTLDSQGDVIIWARSCSEKLLDLPLQVETEAWCRVINLGGKDKFVLTEIQISGDIFFRE